MRFIVMHKTSPHWETGASPSRELVARVGGLIGDLVRAGAFQSGEGLRPSSEGVRLTCRGGECVQSIGPFTTGDELPAGFTILRTATLDEAVDWAKREAAILGDVEIDVRPVTEAWDIGLTSKPAVIETRRYMALRKATPATESGAAPTPAQRSALAKLIDESARAGIHLATESMQPSRRGRRYVNARSGVSAFDGPFMETKELIGGYMIVSAGSLDEAGRMAERYIGIVETDEVDVRELE